MNKYKIIFKLSNIIRLIIGILFIIAAISKTLSISNFIYVIFKFDIVPVVMITTVAFSVIILEYTLGILLILGFFMRLTIISSILLMSIFFIVILINIIRGNLIECGCFGDLVSQTLGWNLLIRNFTIICLLLVITMQRKIIKTK